MVPAASPVDTAPEIRDLMVERWRAASVAERVEGMLQVTADVERMAVAGIRRQHPDLDDEHIRYELFRRRYGGDLARKVYPHLAD